MTPRDADTVRHPEADLLTWLGEPGQALAELAFGRASRGAERSQARHLALLPSETLDLDLTDPNQRQFGDYELIELIGEGGMGVVYRARQISLEREVAVKLLAAGPWASREFVERFRREAQNAARMQHPNIVAIYEIGTAEELHFFSMRLVHGHSLAAAVAEKGPLDPLAAARLMRTIAEALSYAHSLGVLHLDLKPANVLLDENGTPHVADFGLARRLDAALAVDNDEVSGTPAYMAPEQAEIRAQKITTATDIWGLGAILYELVGGYPPFRGATAQATLALVRDGHVQSPRQYVRNLPRDLEAIILKCLAREPGERYASSRALADDLGRFVDGRAVQARPLSTAQRLARWMRREPKLAAASLLIVLALVGGLLATTHQWRRAQNNAERAESVRRFLTGVFQHASPDENKGQPFTAHQLLELGEKELDKNTTQDAAIRADTTALLGRLYIDISDFERSEALLKRALAMLDDPTIPDDVRARVLVGMAMIENEKGENDAAIAYARQSLGILEKTRSSDGAEIANAHDIIESALFGKGSKAEAEALAHAYIAQDMAAIGANNIFVADQWVQLGNTLGSVGRFDESETAFKHAIASFSAATGPQSNGVAHALNELSNMLEDKGDLTGAEKALDEALAIRMATDGPDHHDTIAVEGNLLWLLEFEGRYVEALPKRLAFKDHALAAGQLHPKDLAAVLSSIGKDYRELGRFAEAVQAQQEAVKLGLNDDGTPTAPSILHVRQLGLAQVLAGDYANAEKNLLMALAFLQSHDPPTSPNLNLIRADLGNLKRLQHRFTDAVAELGAANETLAATVNDTNTARPIALSELSEAELDAGDPTLAAKTASEALDRARKAYPKGHYIIAMPMFALARAYLALDRANEAETLLQEALAMRSPPHPATDPRVLEIKVAQVQALDALARGDEAKTLRATIEPTLRASTTPYASDLLARLHAAPHEHRG